jgi:hypothetical protein
MKRFIFVMYYVQVVVVFFFGLKGENMFAWRKHKAFIGRERGGGGGLQM